jgi:hypothetical protein
MIVWSVMYVEMYFITKSIWPVVLMHTIEDAFVNPLILGGSIKIASMDQFLISPLFGIIPIILYLCIGLLLRRKRIQLNRNIASI